MEVSPGTPPKVPLPYKLVVVGEEGSGKSSLTIQFVSNVFVSNYCPSVEDEFNKKCVIDDQPVSVSIVDTANLDYYYSYGVFHSHQGEGFLLVYAVNSRSSFETVQNFWEVIMRAASPMRRHPSFFIVIATKVDLQVDWEVSAEEGRDFAKRVGCDFIETSAMQDINVEKAFHDLIRLIKNYDKMIGNDRTQDITSTRRKEASCTPSCCSGCVVA